MTLNATYTASSQDTAASSAESPAMPTQQAHSPESPIVFPWARTAASTGAASAYASLSDTYLSRPPSQTPSQAPSAPPTQPTSPIRLPGVVPPRSPSPALEQLQMAPLQAASPVHLPRAVPPNSPMPASGQLQQPDSDMRAVSNNSPAKLHEPVSWFQMPAKQSVVSGLPFSNAEPQSRQSTAADRLPTSNGHSPHFADDSLPQSASGGDRHQYNTFTTALHSMSHPESQASHQLPWELPYQSSVRRPVSLSQTHTLTTLPTSSLPGQHNTGSSRNAFIHLSDESDISAHANDVGSMDTEVTKSRSELDRQIALTTRRNNAGNQAGTSGLRNETLSNGLSGARGESSSHIRLPGV